MLGILLAIFSPVGYETNAKLMPEMQSSQGPAGNLLQQYGGLLGINGSSSGLGQNNSIPPQLFPDILQSLPYQMELMNTPLVFSRFDTTVTAHTFFSEIYGPTIFDLLKGYTIGLPSKIGSLFKTQTLSKNTSITKKVTQDSILALNASQMRTIGELFERVNINVNQQSGVISISSQLPDPKASAQLTQTAIRLLRSHVREYRTQKAQQNVEFVKTQLSEAKKRFEKAQSELAEFRDSNVNLATAKAQTREQELQSQYDLAFNLYNSLAQRLEQAKLNLQEKMPVLTVLQPVNVPLDNSSPNIPLIILVSLVIGGIAGAGWVVIEQWWNEGNLKRVND